MAGRHRIGLIGMVACSAVAAMSNLAQAAAIDVEFANFAVGATFPNASLPRTIVADGFDVLLSEHNRATFANGRIVDAARFGESNNALFLASNFRAEIVLPAPSTGGFFLFRDQGGTNLLEINGETMNFDDAALAGVTFGTVGGVSVHSSPLTGPYRTTKLEGTINTLAFIGQELTIDSIVLRVVPEPASLAMVLIGLLTMSMYRRRGAS